jgi:hypothetical protein
MSLWDWRGERFFNSHSHFQVDMAHATRHGRRGGLDMYEIAPGRFLIYNAHINSAIKREGDVRGRLFELTTWRREGLLARLRARGFAVRTLADRVAALPELPTAPPIGGPGWRRLTSPIEHISHFDLRNLRWRPLATELRDGAAGVTLYVGWVLRRRKGRGPASYYLAVGERGGGIGLQPFDETEAILAGYAQALDLDDRPLLAERAGDRILLPDVELPRPHQALLRSVATASDAGLYIDEHAWPLAQKRFGRIGGEQRLEEQ